MKRTSITLPDELSVLLEREAHRAGTSISEITRRALSSYLGGTAEQRPLPFAALGGSGFRHTARDFEEILADEWTSARGR